MSKRIAEVIYQPDGTAVIPLTRGLVTVIDQQDADLGVALWWAHPDGGGHIDAARGVRSGDGKKTEYLHRVILARKLRRPLRPGEQVDHIDGNPLNNRRANLRPASHAQNIRNRRVPMTNASGFKGVHWRRGAGKWRAVIRHNGQQRHLGYFNSRIEAARAYDDAARDLFGAFAALNFPRPGEQSAHRNHEFGSISR